MMIFLALPPNKVTSSTSKDRLLPKSNKVLFGTSSVPREMMMMIGLATKQGHFIDVKGQSNKVLFSTSSVPREMMMIGLATKQGHFIDVKGQSNKVLFSTSSVPC